MNTPTWLAEAMKFDGLHEGIGNLDNQVIIGWARELGGWYAPFYKHDEVPWCGLFVAAMVHRTLDVKLPANALGALNWANWGVALEEPIYGAICSFHRPGGGHVGFYVGEDNENYHIFGGNQSDQVCTRSLAKQRLVAAVWPQDQPHLLYAKVQLDPSGKVSTNEA